MIKTIVLDSGPLGLVSNPKPAGFSLAALQWFQGLAGLGVRFVIPEIVDYELRRELLRAGKQRGLASLNALITQVEYLPLNTQSMNKAAQLWAEARRNGYPTAHDESLDVDVILAAQSLILSRPNLIVATTNPKHLSHFVAADYWQNIS